MEDPTPEQVEAPEGGCGPWEAHAGASSRPDRWTRGEGSPRQGSLPDFCSHLRGCWGPGPQDLVLWYRLFTNKLGRLSVSIHTLKAADSVR
ncbi:hypothetical protein GRJ2_001302600 [Grus japonensis]|uniref:Uncharacterized protein n=1 Tax=Grus japonensis TaxID=30415 RepID=A0ABC9WSE9_GRUJA